MTGLRFIRPGDLTDLPGAARQEARQKHAKKAHKKRDGDVRRRRRRRRRRRLESTSQRAYPVTGPRLHTTVVGTMVDLKTENMVFIEVFPYF